MMTLGKTLTDDEYVEQVRKHDRGMRRLQWIWPLLLVAMLYSLVRFGDVVRDITSDFPIEKRMVYTGMSLGAMFGFMFCMIAMQAGICIKHWMDARHGFRTERLMLKYHDELKEKENGQKRCAIK